jgi:hypothetical protein
MAALVLALGAGVSAADERPLPETIFPAVDYLLQLNANSAARTVAPGKLAPLVDFILQGKPAGRRYLARGHELLDPLVYHEFTLPRSLGTILSYAHHPAIPSHVFALSSLRHSYWKTVDGQPGPFPQALADRLTALDAPLVVHGIEHEEITPDLNSGAYYSYDLDRTLIMCRVEGRLVWISLARQRDRSDVGRKGYVLGPDQAWNYLYSGDEGVTMTGLGWVDTYMYDGFSAIVYIQSESDPRLVRCGAFKWLRAGWNNFNFVKPDHIRRGLVRYAETFRDILQTPGLPAPDRVAAAAETIRALGRSELERRARQALEDLEASYGAKKVFPQEWFQERVEAGPYLSQLTRAQLEARLFLAYMKEALGRQSSAVRAGSSMARAGDRALP